MLLLIVALASVGATMRVQAQPTYHWASDQRVPGYLDDTFTPYLLADQNRTVHAFASQFVDSGNRRLAIVYRKWTLAGGWTRPVDILLAPTGDATFLAAYLDVFGVMHVFFSNGNGQSAVIYYANAPAALADSVQAWSAPAILGGAISGVNSAALTGDDKGSLVFIYSGTADGNGVYSLHSSDSGQNWSDPVQVFLTQDPGLVPFSLRIFPGKDQQIRTAWNVVTNVGVDEQLYFANYDILSGKWSKPVQLDRRIDSPGYFGPSFPTLVDNGVEIVITYNGGNPFKGQPVDPGRPVQRSIISIDGGKTWSEPSNPFPFHVGRSGEHTMVLDGIGRPHTSFVQRIESNVDGKYSIIGGIWHSVFENGGWSNPDRFVTTYSPHDVRSVVVQGNILLVVWRQDPGEGKHGIWYSYTVLDNPELPVVPLPTAVLANDSNQQPDGTPTPGTFPTPTPPQLTDKQQGITDTNINPASPLIYGILPVIIVIGLLVIYQVMRARQ